jgi:glycosyltransferase involved in cell wall biosynthesis
VSSLPEGKKGRPLDRRAALDLPESQRDRWLSGFALLYHEAVNAARDKDRASKGRQSYLLPVSWRTKLAMMRHLLRVHRYKPRDEILFVPDIERDAGVEPVESALLPVLLPWMIDDFKVLARNEPSLWPDREFQSRFVLYKPKFNLAPGQLYFHLYALLSDAKIEAVVLCPWLKRGGADKGALQFVEYYAKQGGVALITTLDAESPWLEKAREGVQILEFGKLAKDLTEDERITVLTRLLLELAPRIVHNMNSELAWRCLSRHGKALRSVGVKLVASLFMDELTASGHPFGYAITYMPEVRDFIDLMVIDNAPYRETIRRRYYLSERRVRRVPFWHELPPNSQAAASPDRSAEAASVLWAGRLCYQKRLDILFAVAQACADIKFEVFGESDETKFVAMWRRRLADLPNVSLHGAYESFHSVAERGGYRAFLYTTAFDGLPNVLLEAASHGLAIVAPPAIGGLADLIGPETAFPVDDAAEAASYVHALRRCIADPTEAMGRAQNAFEIVRLGHSREAFNAAMDEALAAIREVAPRR